MMYMLLNLLFTEHNLLVFERHTQFKIQLKIESI